MKLIDPIDIKQSIKDGQLEAFAARGKVYIKDVKSGDCVKILEEQPSAEPNLQPTCNQLATDCISRQGAIDAVNELTRWYYETYHEKRPTAIAVIDKLINLPSAEPEIIRCMECKHYKIDHPNTNGYHCCYRNHNIFPMNEDDFCSRAERRTDE